MNLYEIGRLSMGKYNKSRVLCESMLREYCRYFEFVEGEVDGIAAQEIDMYMMKIVSVTHESVYPKAKVLDANTK